MLGASGSLELSEKVLSEYRNPEGTNEGMESGFSNDLSSSSASMESGWNNDHAQSLQLLGPINV